MRFTALTWLALILSSSKFCAGATFMAAGSSAPELFVALIGVIFYPDDNPGPGEYLLYYEFTFEEL